MNFTDRAFSSLPKGNVTLQNIGTQKPNTNVEISKVGVSYAEATRGIDSIIGKISLRTQQSTTKK